MRRYGNDNWPEDKTRCIAECYDNQFGVVHGAILGGEQCSRKRKYGPGGLFCKQHAKLMASEKGYVKVPKDDKEAT